MKIFRAERYWEHVRNEMVDILDAIIGVDDHEPVIWEDVRKEAIDRLYVRGMFQDIGV